MGHGKRKDTNGREKRRWIEIYLYKGEEEMGRDTNRRKKEERGNQIEGERKKTEIQKKR